MKTAVIYKTKYGITRQYANWICEEIKTKAYNLDANNNIDLTYFDTLIFGSNVYMGEITILDYILKKWESIRSKYIVLFVVGVIGHNEAKSQKLYENIPEYVRTNIKYYKLPGKIDTEKLDFFDKLVVEDLDAQDAIIAKEKILPIVEYVRKLEA